MIQIDMPMPKNCHECYLSIWAEGEYWCPWHNCTVDGHDGDIKRMNDCPLIEGEEGIIKESELNRKHATNGDIIKALFNIKEVEMSHTYCVHFPEEEDFGHYFFKDWWNSPYKRGDTE